MEKLKDRPAFLDKATLWERGNQYEHFEEGQVFEHHWGRTFNSGDNTLFSALTLHYTPLYFNAEYAKSMGHDKIPVNPLLVFNTVLGLSVEDLSEAGNGPFLGISELEYHAVVYEGDTITCKSLVIGKRTSKKIPTHGIVSWSTEGFNQKGEMVISFKRSNLVTFKSTKDTMDGVFGRK